ncbi:MAG: CoA-binding protein [Burkholderiales bacterium]
MSFVNPDPEAIRALLTSVKNIAVVGFSPMPSRPSHNISRQLQRFGYRIIPVRPAIPEGLGEKAYRDLGAVPDRIDLVNLFRNGKYAPETVDECLRLGVKNLWMQEGCVNEAAAERARAAGMTVVMDRCILRDFTRLCTE